MAIDPFKSSKYQVGSISNAITADVNGNLIFSDSLNSSGVTLSELVQSTNTIVISGGSSGSTTGTTKEILTTDFVQTTYTFDGNAYFNGYVYTVTHNLSLNTKYSFTSTVYDTVYERMVIPQEILPIDTNSFKIIMATPMNLSVAIIKI